MTDLVAAMGPSFLGTRLKRLGEHLQANAAAVLADRGIPIQPGQVSVFAALRDGPRRVSEIVERIGMSQPGVTRAAGQLERLGLVEVLPGQDQRTRLLAMTPAGEAVMARLTMEIWPGLANAVDAILTPLSGSLLDQVGGIEAALGEKPLLERVPPALPRRLILREYEPALAPAFKAINTEWIEAMFTLEQADRDTLDDPQGSILAGGGAILFVEAEGLGVVGTCALRRSGGSAFELTKMGVLQSSRGLKAGEFLLTATIARARRMGADPLYLLTNSACAAAIHLYEKNGFVHDAGIMADYGARYARCDVAMRHVGGPAHRG